MSEKIKKLAWVDRTLCAACGVCMKVCPKKAITIYKGLYALVEETLCIGCKKCVTKCPHEAITVVNNLAQIDYDKCTGCGNCVDNCPTGCLKRLIAPAHSQDVEAEE